MLVALIGGSGAVGDRMRSKLLGEGHDVILLSRSSQWPVDVRDSRWWSSAAWQEYLPSNTISNVSCIVNLATMKSGTARQVIADNVATVRATAGLRDACESSRSRAVATMAIGSIAEWRVSRRASAYVVGKRAARLAAHRYGLGMIVTIGLVSGYERTDAMYGQLRSSLRWMPSLAHEVPCVVSDLGDICDALVSLLEHSVSISQEFGPGTISLALAGRQSSWADILKLTTSSHKYRLPERLLGALGLLEGHRPPSVDRIGSLARLAISPLSTNHYSMLVADEDARIEWPLDSSWAILRSHTPVGHLVVRAT
jgi:nucleoside-diphosphate-sugar epimerase